MKILYQKKYSTSECHLIEFKKNRLCCKCKICGKRSFKSINRLIKKFQFVYLFVPLLIKSVYPCEDMDSWEKFNEISLPDKKIFYSNLNLEDITDKNYAHSQKVWKVVETKDRVEYHDLYVQCDTLLLADVFLNFRDKFIEIYKLDTAHFFHL